MKSFDLYKSIKVKRFEEHGIEIKQNDNPDSWYADVKFYTTEYRYPCSDKVWEEIFFCDEKGCRFK